MIGKSLVCFVILAALATAQTMAPRRSVRAYGEGTVSIRPDQARLSINVITQAQTAQEAADANASQSATLLAALRQVLGANADIKTISYSIVPNYRSQTGSPPVLVGYTATNTYQVTVPDPAVVGRVIDAAAQAGASTVGGISFSLRDSVPQQLQALRLASQQARTKAEAIAQGLNLRLGAVLQADEGFSTRTPVVDSRLGAGAGAPTQIEVGTMEVRATVTLEVELVQ